MTGTPGTKANPVPMTTKTLARFRNSEVGRREHYIEGASELLGTDGDKYRRLQCRLRKATAAAILQFNFS